jgi:hypothetical protein
MGFVFKSFDKDSKKEAKTRPLPRHS